MLLSKFTKSTSLFLASIALALCVPVVHAQKYKVLHSFNGTDGAYPYSGVVRDKKGNLYGTTGFGGDFGSGNVYKLDKKGNLTVLYSFTGGGDGLTPDGGVAVDKLGNVYGTTFAGGRFGAGVIYKVDSNKKETVLHNFAGGTTDGCAPWADVHMDKAGFLYGTTTSCGASGYGVVWKSDTLGNVTVLHSFGGAPSDGDYPWYDGVLIDGRGNLYGVTDQGGAKNVGALYQLSPSGTLTLLYGWTGLPPDYSGRPFGTPAMDAAGNLYGTTYTSDYTNCNSWGTVWKWTPNGGVGALHCFAGGPSDGGGPRTGVVLDPASNIYGVTEAGGSSSYGVVFKVDSLANESVIHNFGGGGTDGAAPEGQPIMDSKGHIYGTTALGGTSAFGTIWELTP